MHISAVSLHIGSLHYPIVHVRVEVTCIRSSPRGVAHPAGEKWCRASKCTILIADTIHFSDSLPKRGAKRVLQ